MTSAIEASIRTWIGRTSRRLSAASITANSPGEARINKELLSEFGTIASPPSSSALPPGARALAAPDEPFNEPGELLNEPPGGPIGCCAPNTDPDIPPDGEPDSEPMRVVLLAGTPGETKGGGAWLWPPSSRSERIWLSELARSSALLFCTSYTYMRRPGVVEPRSSRLIQAAASCKYLGCGVTTITAFRRASGTKRTTPASGLLPPVNTSSNSPTRVLAST